MSFHNVQFPTDLSYGSEGGPGHQTAIVELDSGAEQRVGRWTAARREYDASYSIRKFSELATVLTFCLARQGALHSFRFKDWNDYSTGSNHRDTPAFDDVVIGTGDGSTTQFQLVKKYTQGDITRTRTITKPIESTVKIGVGGSEQSVGWSVDDTTGKVVFTTAPSNGDEITAGFEFDVHVRFSEDVDEALRQSIEGFEHGRVREISVVEVIEESPVDDEFNYGGVFEKAIDENLTLSVVKGRLVSIEAESTGLKVILPDPANIPPGGPIFYIAATGASEDFAVADESETTLVTLSANEAVEILLTVDGSGDRIWYVF